MEIRKDSQVQKKMEAQKCGQLLNYQTADFMFLVMWRFGSKTEYHSLRVNLLT